MCSSISFLPGIRISVSFPGLGRYAVISLVVVGLYFDGVTVTVYLLGRSINIASNEFEKSFSSFYLKKIYFFL